MLTIQLTKLEATLDTLKKAYPKLKATDVSLLSTALSIAGRHALASFNEEHYEWPKDTEKLTSALVVRIKSIEGAMEPLKKVTKNSPEEEPITVIVGLAPNHTAGESLLGNSSSLKTLYSDILEEGIEFSYQPHDLGWQWALDRVNWKTVSQDEIKRKVKVHTEFTEGATGAEMGTGTKKKARGKAAKAEAAPKAEVAATI